MKVKNMFWSIVTVVMMLGATVSGVWYSLQGDKTAAVLGWLYFILFFGMFYAHFKQNQRLENKLRERDDTIIELGLEVAKRNDKIKELEGGK